LRRLTESARAASAAPAAAAPASAPTPAPAPAVAPAPAATAPSAPATRVTPPPPASSPAGPPSEAAEPAPLAGSGTLEHLIEALRKSNRTFFGTALARATFAIEGSKLLLTVGGNFEQARCEGRRSWIEETAQQVLGRRHVLEIRVVAQAVEATPDPTELDRARLKEQALKSEAVQATLDVFAADVRDAEEIT
jgi:hypothetical protein